MISLSSLLNPAPPGPIPGPRSHPSPTVSSPATSYSEAETVASLDRPLFSRIRARDSARITKPARPRGLITFPPFEVVDEASAREIARFRVTPFGRIQESCAHIPYNSGKKDFFDKTGRESFEVFKYDFRPPGDETEYTVMWDYNIGLVRMTPFFKCCQYGKTMPAKMLNMNPGLKDITHSITGGAISAQGYWMPYSCAKAVCATFCHKIAGALIPIFGPAFPSLCAPPDSPAYGRMIIDASIVNSAKIEAARNRRNHGVPSASGSPRGRRTPARSTPERDTYAVANRAAFQHQARLGVQRSSCSPYNTDSDSGRSVPDGSWSPGSSAYLCGPAPRTSGWTPANQSVPSTPHPETQTWASAIPRFAPPGTDPRLRPWKGHSGKRYIEEAEDGYEGGAESQANSPSMGVSAKGPGPGKGPNREEAMLLLNLRAPEKAVEFAERAVEGLHRAKRLRASSL